MSSRLYSRHTCCDFSHRTKSTVTFKCGFEAIAGCYEEVRLSDCDIKNKLSELQDSPKERILPSAQAVYAAAQKLRHLSTERLVARLHGSFHVDFKGEPQNM